MGRHLIGTEHSLSTVTGTIGKEEKQVLLLSKRFVGVRVTIYKDGVIGNFAIGVF